MEKSEVLVEVFRDNEYLLVPPGMLTTEELCMALDRIQIDSDEFVSQQEISEGYAAINEAIRRLEGKEGVQNGKESNEKKKPRRNMERFESLTDAILEFEKYSPSEYAGCRKINGKNVWFSSWLFMREDEV